VPSPAETVAGGVILDVAPRRHRRQDASVETELTAREHADVAGRAVLELAKHSAGLDTAALARRISVQEAVLDGELKSAVEQGLLVRIGPRWLTMAAWETLRRRLIDALRAYHRGQPLRAGMPREELRTRSGMPADLLSGALNAMRLSSEVVERGSEVALTSHRRGLTSEQQASVEAFLAELDAQPFNPPPLTELVRRHGLSPALVQYLVREQQVVRVSDDTVFARKAYEQAVSRLREHLASHQTLTVAAARDVLGSSRRYVLPLLEWLDAQKITRRVGDDRILRD
jgi:selenocysteine-specific elongation factor